MLPSHNAIPISSYHYTPTPDFGNAETVTSLFLSCLGYSCNMPRSIVYAPKSVGGLSLCNLGVEQGIQVLHLLRNLCANTTNGKLYTMITDSYQLFTGLS